ncbi:BRCA1-associated RING domain protein 1 [Linum perenne]
MASENVRSMNPGFLHLQKLGLELKCPLCLDLLKKPHLLPCDHIFCSLCLPGSTQLALQCPYCESSYTDKDIRHVPLIENIVSIYKGLNAAFSMTARHSVSVASGQHSPSLQSKDDSVKASFNARRCSFATVDGKKVGGESVMGDKCSLPRCLKYDNQVDFVMSVEEGGCGGKSNGESPLQTGAQTLEEDGGLNQVDQLSLGSQSFGDLKDSENDSNDHCGGDDVRNCMLFQTPQNRDEDKKRLQDHGSSDSGTPEEHIRNSKRQKLNYNNSVDSNITKAGHCEPMISQTENLAGTGNHNPAVANQLSTTDKVCGFCHFSKISENTGPMMHYVDGKVVDGCEANVSNAVHVHRICIDWAPQVYFEGETIKNLKEELARGAKLKCSGCGRKGAALGCYVKSCRKSYHVPCAMENSESRWDMKNFLLLCPVHSCYKFPSEKSKRVKQKPYGGHKRRALDNLELAQRDSKQSNNWADSSNRSKEWVFCGSALSPEDKLTLVDFGNSIDVRVTKFWRPDVTHVIADGACTRTLKVLMATLNGKWVLTMDWIKACMESKSPVDEEPYEVSRDNHGSTDGPRTGRLCASNNKPKLFQEFNFYLSGDFIPRYKKDLQTLIEAAGGTICRSKEELLEEKNTESKETTLVVYNLDPTRGCKLGDEVSILWERLNDAQDVAARAGCQVICHTWVLECIAAYKLQPLDHLIDECYPQL